MIVHTRQYWRLQIQDQWFYLSNTWIIQQSTVHQKEKEDTVLSGRTREVFVIRFMFLDHEPRMSC